MRCQCESATGIVVTYQVTRPSDACNPHPNTAAAVTSMQLLERHMHNTKPRIHRAPVGKHDPIFRGQLLPRS